jgi:hypothetical protein
MNTSMRAANIKSHKSLLTQPGDPGGAFGRRMTRLAGRPRGAIRALVAGTLRRFALFAALGAVSLLSACGGGGGGGNGGSTGLACDDSIKSGFILDPSQVGGNTTVLLVKQFRKGDQLVLPNSTLPANVTPLTAAADMCLVKLVVGPGFMSEPPTADSWSQGIGFEVYLPEKAAWNNRIRTYGSGGYAGGFHTSLTKLGQNLGQGSGPLIAAVGKGYVVTHSDHGHVGGAIGNNGGGQATWAMKTDGTLNVVLWQDFAERSMHVETFVAKAMTKAYYGKDQKYAYWDGFSTGGRQGYKLVQKWPTDYDGYLIGSPAFNWPKFVLGGAYAAIVTQNDVGHIIPSLKLNYVSAQAVKACDTLNLGFLLDPRTCTYDPTKDAAALCSGVAGNGVTGTNADATKCVNLAEARAIDKMWYGWTRDGSVPDPALDNGNGTSVAPNQLWYGNTRGTNLTGINAAGVLPAGPALAVAASAAPLTLSLDFLTLVLQDPTYAWTNFTNATGNGQSKYLTLTYPAFALAYDKALAMNDVSFSNIATDNADLSGVRDSGRKVLHYHGLADEVIFPQGCINYYTRVAGLMGGFSEVQKFDRLYLIPGMAHDSTFVRSGTIDPTTLAIDNTKFPTPQNSTGRDELFVAMMNWVENGVAPGRIEVSSSNNSINMPLCVYPQKATYNGSGDVRAAASYTCT